MGFSTLGGWGKTVNELYEDGPHWTSRKRRSTEKHRFICGISSTIAFTVAGERLAWVKDEIKKVVEIKRDKTNIITNM